jgi:hypothetical protein
MIPPRKAIRPRPQRCVDVAQSGGVGEPRIDMYERRPALLRLQCKAEGDRVVFGHVGPITRMQSALARSHCGSVAAPLP